MKDYTENTRLTLKEGTHLRAAFRWVEGEYPIHWHHHFELELILAGEGVCEINREGASVPEFRLFFLTPTDFHALHAKGRISLFNLAFDETVLSGQELGALLSPALRRAYALTREEHERLSAAARLLVHEYESGGDCTRALLSYFLSFLLRRNKEALLLAAPIRDEDGIKRAYAYLELHFKERITLGQLAAEAGYHPAYFSELFRRVMGEGYSEAIARLRVAYARSLLLSGFSVTEACFGSGFGSLSAFGAAFRRLVGLSPRDYKKQHLAVK